MRDKLKALYELQQIDIDLGKTQKAKSNLDDGSAKRHQVAAVRAKFDRADKLYHEATAEMQDKELNLKSTEAKQKTFHDKMYSGKVSNPKELESMEKEIEMLGRQKGTLEERILELMDIIETRKAAIATASVVVDGYEAELAALTEKVKGETDILNDRIQQLTADREKALANVAPVLLKRYEAMRARLGVAVSRIEAASCTACHTQITSGLMNALRNAEDIQTCENCSRIIYLEK